MVTTRSRAIPSSGGPGLGAPVILRISPGSGGLPGSVVTITGQNFSSVTSVLFDNVPATSFTIVNSNTITATVPL